MGSAEALPTLAKANVAKLLGFGVVDIHRSGHVAISAEAGPLNTIEASVVGLESLTNDVWLEQA